MTLKIPSAFEGEVFRDVRLVPWNYYRVGGPADVFLVPRHEADVVLSVQSLKSQGKNFFVLGGGTNLLIRDGGLEDPVLYLGPKVAAHFSVVNETSTTVLLRVPAWASKASVLLWALRHKLGGLEFSAGIPGTMGGAVYMNAGTKWGSYSDVIQAVRYVDASGDVVMRSKEELVFSYRGHGHGFLNDAVLLSVDLLLERSSNAESSLALVNEILQYRGSKQPLEFPNCGSVFKNPLDSQKGAGRLIEASGLKGRRVGRAMISNKHANFFLNLGGASAKDLEGLMQIAETEVLHRFGVKLEREVVCVGRE